MVEVELLAQLASAVKIAGGVRAVASRANLDASNLSKFLRTARGLSSDSVRQLETALGRPGGLVSTDQVIRLDAKGVDDELALALAWYLPEGAEVARASWLGLYTENLKKLLSLRFLPEIYAFRDGNGCRLIVALPAGLILPAEIVGANSSNFRWFHDDRQQAILNLDDDDASSWINGEVTPALFDAAWPTMEHAYTADELLAHVRRLGISWNEAIRRVSYNE